MKCLGRTRTLQRCKNNARIIVCHKHRFEPWFALLAVLGFIGMIAGLYQDAWKPLFGVNESTLTYNAQQPSQFDRVTAKLDNLSATIDSKLSTGVSELKSLRAKYARFGSEFGGKEMPPKVLDELNQQFWVLRRRPGFFCYEATQIYREVTKGKVNKWVSDLRLQPVNESRDEIESLFNAIRELEPKHVMLENLGSKSDTRDVYLRQMVDKLDQLLIALETYSARQTQLVTHLKTLATKSVQDTKETRRILRILDAYMSDPNDADLHIVGFGALMGSPKRVLSDTPKD